jgi:hypothetical protein
MAETLLLHDSTRHFHGIRLLGLHKFLLDAVGLSVSSLLMLSKSSESFWGSESSLEEEDDEDDEDDTQGQSKSNQPSLESEESESSLDDEDSEEEPLLLSEEEEEDDSQGHSQPNERCARDELVLLLLFTWWMEYTAVTAMRAIASNAAIRTKGINNRPRPRAFGIFLLAWAFVVLVVSSVTTSSPSFIRTAT